MYATTFASHVLSLYEPVVLMIDFTLYIEINFAGLSN